MPYFLNFGIGQPETLQAISRCAQQPAPYTAAFVCEKLLSQDQNYPHLTDSSRVFEQKSSTLNMSISPDIDVSTSP